MNWLGRRLVNFGNARRSARALNILESRLQLPFAPRILELGCGRGGMSVLLQERFQPGRLVVTDFDPRQVEAARAYLTRCLETLPPVVELRQVDARRLPFDAASFDCVFAMAMLHHVEAHHFDYRERPKALAEIRRVLSPGGTLAFSEFSRTEDLRRTLGELGFTPTFEKRGWRGRELALFRSPQ
ncbi:MAG: class I SAM-dependent methyltransferase [Thermoplasmata archaeon]